MSKRLLIAAATAGGLSLAALQVHATPVDLELGIVMDVSGSVDQSEFELQRDGYGAAFKTPAVKNFINDLVASGSNGIAASVFYFGTTADDGALYGQKIGWTQISSDSDAVNFGNMIESLAEPETNDGGIGQTNIADGINEAAASMLGNSFDGSRLVLDVSGDGRQSVDLDGGFSCVPPRSDCDPILTSERDEAANNGITINGLAIIDSFADLLTYYNDKVITSDGFAREATFASFGSAVEDKVIREITGREVPEPTTLSVLGAGLAGVGFAAWRRRRVG